MGRRLRAVLAFGLCATGAFSLGLAFGGGGSFDISPVTLQGTYSSTTTEVRSEVSLTARQFLDFTYGMVEIGYALNRGSTEPTAAATSTAFAAVLTGVSFTAALKYPFELGPVALFPMVGAEYVLNLGYTDDKGNNLKSTLAGPASALNELWLKGGLGLDVYLGPIFVRPIVEAGFKPLVSGRSSSWTSTQATGTTTITLGTFTVDIELLVGVKF
ncbi:MAG TPA: hypothetical protein VFI08_07150 [Spirochaetia bacterium]|nr:hypothetical protein [Spirochaetia bacterium]